MPSRRSPAPGRATRAGPHLGERSQPAAGPALSDDRRALRAKALQATAKALERRRDGLGKFASIFRRVADAPRAKLRHGSHSLSLREYVSRAGEKLTEQIADAPGPFWNHVREALAERHP